MDLRDAMIFRLNRCAERRKELEDLLTVWVSEAVEAKVFEWFAEHREEIVEELRREHFEILALPKRTTRRMTGLRRR